MTAKLKRGSIYIFGFAVLVTLMSFLLFSFSDISGSRDQDPTTQAHDPTATGTQLGRPVAPLAVSPSKGPPVTREALAPPGEVSIKITDSEGAAVTAEIRARELTQTVHGRIALPRNTGSATVTAVGHRPVTIYIGTEDIHVVLEKVWCVSVRVFDAVTQAPIVARARLDGEDTSLSAVCDASGTLEIDDLVAGRYRMFLDADGYIDVERPRATVRGVQIDVRENLELHIPLYPVLGAVLLPENRTNLPDTVLRHMVVMNLDEPDSMELLPGFAEHMRDDLTKALLRRFGAKAGFAVFLGYATAPYEQRSKVRVWVRGGAKQVHDIVLQPLPELQQLDGIFRFPINGSWPVAKVRIDTPVDMEIGWGSQPFSRIPVPPGGTTLVLPHGEYSLGTAATSLLDDSKWRRHVRVGQDITVRVPTAEVFGTLLLTKAARWTDGYAVVSGNGREFSVRPHAQFPVSVCASIGEYVIRIATPSAPSETWRKAVRVQPWQTHSIEIGNRE